MDGTQALVAPTIQYKSDGKTVSNSRVVMRYVHFLTENITPNQPKCAELAAYVWAPLPTLANWVYDSTVRAARRLYIGWLVHEAEAEQSTIRNGIPLHNENPCPPGRFVGLPKDLIQLPYTIRCLDGVEVAIPSSHLRLVPNAGALLSKYRSRVVQHFAHMLSREYEQIAIHVGDILQLCSLLTETGLARWIQQIDRAALTETRWPALVDLLHDGADASLASVRHAASLVAPHFHKATRADADLAKFSAAGLMAVLDLDTVPGPEKRIREVLLRYQTLRPQEYNSIDLKKCLRLTSGTPSLFNECLNNVRGHAWLGHDLAESIKCGTYSDSRPERTTSEKLDSPVQEVAKALSFDLTPETTQEAFMTAVRSIADCTPVPLTPSQMAKLKACLDAVGKKESKPDLRTFYEECKKRLQPELEVEILGRGDYRLRVNLPKDIPEWCAYGSVHGAPLHVNSARRMLSELWPEGLARDESVLSRYDEAVLQQFVKYCHGMNLGHVLPGLCNLVRELGGEQRATALIHSVGKDVTPDTFEGWVTKLDRRLLLPQGVAELLAQRFDGWHQERLPQARVLELVDRHFLQVRTEADWELLVNYAKKLPHTDEFLAEAAKLIPWQPNLFKSHFLGSQAPYNHLMPQETRLQWSLFFDKQGPAPQPRQYQYVLAVLDAQEVVSVATRFSLHVPMAPVITQVADGCWDLTLPNSRIAAWLIGSRTDALIIPGKEASVRWVKEQFHPKWQPAYTEVQLSVANVLQHLKVRHATAALMRGQEVACKWTEAASSGQRLTGPIGKWLDYLNADGSFVVRLTSANTAKN